MKTAAVMKTDTGMETLEVIEAKPKTEAELTEELMNKPVLKNLTAKNKAKLLDATKTEAKTKNKAVPKNQTAKKNTEQLDPDPKNKPLDANNKTVHPPLRQRDEDTRSMMV